MRSVVNRAHDLRCSWEDGTESETADLLGVSVGTVRRHLVCARTHM
jgi:DNA-directed RNA polymerase specialized sigma24 family protein